MMEVSDRILLERWATRQDAEAFAELINRHSAMVYRASLRVLRNAADAEDIAQQCFAKLLQFTSAECNLPTSLGGWLHTVAVRQALDRLRALGRERNRVQQYSAAQETHTEIQFDDLLDRVDEAIAELPENLRQVVVSHFLEGQTHQRIAAELNLSRTTVTSRIRRGIEAIRAHLRRKGVIASVATLTTTLAAESAKASPAHLTAALGKLALSGVTGAPAVPASLLVAGLGVVLMSSKQIILAVLVVAAFFAASWYLLKEPIKPAAMAEASKALDTSDKPEAPLPLVTQDKPAANATQAKSPEPGPKTEKALPDKSAKAPADSAVLEGVVLVSGKPLADVRVRLVYTDGFGPINTQTDEEGMYRVTGLKTGEVQVVVAFRDETQQFNATRNALVEAGYTTRVDILFAETGTLEGYVYLDGKPAAKSSVHVSLAGTEPGEEIYAQRTGEDGSYRFKTVSCGSASVRVLVTDAEYASRIKTATTVINAGLVTQQNFEINSGEGNTVTGWIVGLNESEIGCIRALPGRIEVPTRLSHPFLRDLENQSVAQGGSRFDHPEYRLKGLDAGEYTIVACAITGGEAADLLDWRMASDVITVKNGQENRIDFDLTGEGTPLANIIGTLTGVVPGERIMVKAARGDFELPDSPSEESLAVIVKEFCAQVEWKEGEGFQFKHLDPGFYTLVAFSSNVKDVKATGYGFSVVEVVKDKPTQIELRMQRLDNANEKK